MKKRSFIGVLISLLLSVFLIPLIWVFGIGGTTMMTVSSVIKEERKEDVFSVFTENEGIEWIYGMIEPEIQKVVEENAGEIEGLDVEGLLTVEDVETIVTEFYEAAIHGEVYQMDVTFIAERIKPQLDGIIDKEIDKQIDQEVDNQIDTYIDTNLETIYDSLDADMKAQIKAEVKKVVLAEVEKEFDAQIDEIIEKEVDAYIKENYPNVPESLIAEEKEKYLAENKERIVAEAKAETMEEAEKQFDAEADTYIRENIREIYAQIDEETKAELIALAKEEAVPKIKEEYKAQYKQQYVDEYSAMIDEEVLAVQNEINAAIQSVYETEQYQEVEQMQQEYDVNLYDFDGLHAIFEQAGYLCFGAAGVVVVILLLCYLLRPAGFLVSGVFVLVLGGALKLLAGNIMPVAQNLIADMVVLPHESLGKIIEAALGWAIEGMDAAAMLILIAGAVLFLLGILYSVIRRSRAE